MGSAIKGRGRWISLGLVGLGLASLTWLAAPMTGQQAPLAGAELQQARVGGSVAVEGNAITGLRRFDPGRRTYWHSHEGGFILFVQEGRGRVQRRGEPMRELGPGEIDYTPPGVEHWHGAAANEGFLQLGIVPLGGGIEFKEEVTDAEYNGR